MAAPKKPHFKRNVGIAVLVIALMLIGLVAGLTNDFSTIGIGGSNPTPTAPTPSIPTAQSGYYLNGSEIFVVSANASYGSYPYPTVTYPPFANPPNGLIAQNGEPCVIINVTIRNDYSTQNPAPNPVPYNTTLVTIALTAQIFNGANQITAKDITNAFPIASVTTNKAFTRLNYGESTTLSVYLATNSTDVTSFQIIPVYIGLLTPP